MPGLQVGVYPGYAAGNDAEGTEVSSTYEGRHLTVREDELIHPYIADGFVNKGDPVILCDAGVPATYGRAVGVAFKSGSAAADLISIDTEGIFNLLVYAEDDAGDSAIEIGDPLYIRAGTLPGAASADGTGDAEISKMQNANTQVLFGYALGSMVAGGSGIIAVKVHWDPDVGTADVVKAQEITFVEEGAGVYTGSVTLPAGSTLVNVIVHAVALWDAVTSAALIVGDAADPNGFFDAVDLKATDLLAGEAIDFAHTGGVQGADVDAPAAAVAVRRRYLVGARVVTGEVTSVGAGTAGRTRITVLYSKPATSVLATFV